MHQGHFVARRAAHFENDVRARPDARRVRHDLGTGGLIRFVAEIRPGAGSGLHDDPETELDELLDDFRDRCYTFFARGNFRGHPDHLRGDRCFRNGSGAFLGNRDIVWHRKDLRHGFPFVDVERRSALAGAAL